MRITRHARDQQQRRGISADRLDLVLAYGDEHKAADHATFLRVGKKELLFLQSDCPVALWRRYRDWLNKTVPVVSSSGDIVTAMNRSTPIRRRK